VRRGRPGQRGGQRPGGGAGGGGGGGRPPRSRGAGGSRPSGGRPRTGGKDAGAADQQVEKPRTDDQGVSKEGREQPVIEPTVETTPAPVADAPDTTTTKKQTEDPTKLEQSGDEGKS
jgi:hypothetical protein